MGKYRTEITGGLLMIGLSACASVTFQDQISGQGIVQVTAWTRLRGEFLIYSDARSMHRHLTYPHCISGVFDNQSEIMQSLRQYDDKLVTLTGELFTYSDLPDEKRPILPRKMLTESVVVNACLGPKVLLIKTMRLASQTGSP